MANAHENIDNIALLNKIDRVLKRTYKDKRGWGSAEEQKYEDKEALTKKIFKNKHISDILKLFRDRDRWEPGNIQAGIGVDDVFDSARPISQTAPLSDFMLKTIATPNLLEDLAKLVTGIYDPQSEANIAGVRDVGGERKLDALTKVAGAIRGDDENVLDIIKALQ